VNVVRGGDLLDTGLQPMGQYEETSFGIGVLDLAS
jgi:hypothetical protein